MLEDTHECRECKFGREEKCTLARAGGIKAPHGAECLKDIMEMERERFTG